MSLLIRETELSERRRVAAGALLPLARSLADDLRPLLSRDLYFPTQKALLSREGGRCANDGTLLAFDPFQPHEHRCPRCGEVYRGELHDRFWIYWYQLWLAERAVHAAVLAALDVDRGFATLAESILEGYVDRYSTYPNADNVLGPTRLFFSTYLESIWLLQICCASDLVDRSNHALADRVRESIIEPARAIISEFDEGASNRQVWNAAAILAASRSLGDDRATHHAVFGPSGVTSHIANGLLRDGTWYEGENYHMFAHRGLWYGVTLAERAGMELPKELTDRFQLGFATPFLTALPDFTLPSRRDSQYAISLRQWRIAEHCELGLAREADPALIGALERMYRDDVPRRETGRRASSADVERNGPASSLTRADLSWRALLCARETLPPLEPLAPRSALLDAQGIAVFRRNQGRSYVALDYGHSGGGHGHPDRLNLLISDGSTRWLDDFGTGSYVDPSLHWYRSTLAHNAPFADGTSQQRMDGVLLSYDERGAAGWIVAAADVSSGVWVERAIVVMSEYVIDTMTWRADRDIALDVPLHADIVLDAADPMHPAQLVGGAGTEDGFRFAHDASVQRVGADVVVRGWARTESGDLRLWQRSDRDCEWWRAVAPGPPGSGDHAFRLIRARGTTGQHRSVIAWSPAVSSVEIGDNVRVMLADGSVQVHRRDESGWHMEILAGGARSGIDLAGSLSSRSAATAAGVNAVVAPTLDVGSRARPTVIRLGESHYRRSEQRWTDAGKPTADVALWWTRGVLHVSVDVHQSQHTFADAAAVNRYDNEFPDINGDGVQLYLSSEKGFAAWILVPERESTRVRIRQLEGWPAVASIVATWTPVAAGYRIDVEISDCVPSALDLLINEMPSGRERRRGQLVLSESRGDFIYLRGDRHATDRLIQLHLPND